MPTNLQSQKADLWLPGNGRKEMDGLKGDSRKLWGVIEELCIQSYWFHKVYAFVKLLELCVLNRYRFWNGNYTSINLFLNTTVTILKIKWIFVRARKGLIVQKSKMHDSVSVLYNKGLDKGRHRDHDLWPCPRSQNVKVASDRHRVRGWGQGGWFLKVERMASTKA